MNSTQVFPILLCLVSVLVAASLRGRADEPKPGEQPKYTNALIHSTSPYLLQHAHNPVNWYPWGPEAFAKAKAENKPVFVSIGYSTCYWCHVMERQSFENEQVAKILNENYIAIKVDREERPDIDEQLMMATQLLTGRGGWPNSIWLTTDGRPWMAGTYFPREQFMDALLQLSRIWTNETDKVQLQANSISDAIREASKVEPGGSAVVIDASPLSRVMLELSRTFDEVNGGFGVKPKFPPHGVLRLLAHAARLADPTSSQPSPERDTQQGLAHQMLTKTLDALWCGGIHDQIGGGFHRYSTDERWFLPHFEKMLYDNAQLMRAYTEAFVVTQDVGYRAAVEDIFQWLQREMTHPKGAFYSAIDSESEGGEEGKFYTWSTQELVDVLGSEDADYFSKRYHCSAAGNFTEEASGRRPGTNIPYLSLTAYQNHSDPRLDKIRALLLQARSHREYPHLDDKILTSWNGLMISALARASLVFKEPKYGVAADKAARFILSELQRDGQLLRTWRSNQASLPGYLDDYAFFAEALVELHATSGDPIWQSEAVRICDQMLELFEDPQDGGFYFTSPEHEELILRSKNLVGGGNMPVGNGVAVQVLLRLHATNGQDRYLLAAERALKCFSPLMRKSPRQVEHLVLANAMYLDGKNSSRSTASADEASMVAGEAVTARLYVSQAAVATGEELTVTVELEIADGYHLYGPSQSGLEITETSIVLSKSDWLIAGEVQPPAGVIAVDKLLGESMLTYTGKVRFNLPVKVQETAQPGEGELVVSVHYQACDQRRCLLPVSLQLRAMLQVSKEATPNSKLQPGKSDK